VHAYVRRNMRSAVDRQRQAYYKDRRTYQPTQPVWLWTPRLRPGQSRKFALYSTGPWQINRQLNELMYEITPHHSWARQGCLDRPPKAILRHVSRCPGASLPT
jgi:hypothetical protein